jgi:putative ligand-binding protein with streptavidin-like fold
MEINYLTILVSIIMVVMIAGTSALIPSATGQASMTKIMNQANNYAGIWVTADGYIRQELSADGRFEERHGNKKNINTGRYRINGNHIRYQDDNGLVATGDLQETGILYYGGHVFYRQN